MAESEELLWSTVQRRERLINRADLSPCTFRSTVGVTRGDARYDRGETTVEHPGGAAAGPGRECPGLAVAVAELLDAVQRGDLSARTAGEMRLLHRVERAMAAFDVGSFVRLGYPAPTAQVLVAAE